MGETTNLNWLAGFQPSAVCLLEIPLSHRFFQPRQGRDRDDPGSSESHPAPWAATATNQKQTTVRQNKKGERSAR